MKILLTGATGYIGQRILPVLLNSGHDVYCCVRDAARFNREKYKSDRLHVIEVDFLQESAVDKLPKDIDAAYYLVHSMSASSKDFAGLEQHSAVIFKRAVEGTRARQVIYLSGIVNDPKLSKHLSSRKNVEDILGQGTFALTTLRAGIIIGSGSASFEIIRDLVEKLPFMMAPVWLNTRSQPIAVSNVIEYLSGVLLKPETYGKSFDIGGPDILTYKQMLLRFAEVRGLRRKVLVVPVMTPRLSSYWLYFVTSISYPLAVNLVNSMKVEVIARSNELAEMLGIQLFDYKTSIRKAFESIEQHQVVSSWTDARGTDKLERGVTYYLDVPVHGCFIDKQSRSVSDEPETLERIFSIGGNTGWYYADWLWALRGFLDKLVGGVGLRRGRKDPYKIFAGETLDFWKVLIADRNEMRLLLYAEMKLPGEAWLEFRIEKGILHQTATFRPLGIGGRLYWYAMLPFHAFIFSGMAKQLTMHT